MGAISQSNRNFHCESMQQGTEANEQFGASEKDYLYKVVRERGREGEIKSFGQRAWEALEEAGDRTPRTERGSQCCYKCEQGEQLGSW